MEGPAASNVLLIYHNINRWAAVLPDHLCISGVSRVHWRRDRNGCIIDISVNRQVVPDDGGLENGVDGECSFMHK